MALLIHEDDELRGICGGGESTEIEIISERVVGEKRRKKREWMP